LAAFAATSGYADQAHLAQEGYAIAGILSVGLARERMPVSFNTPVEPLGTMMAQREWEKP
jgi:hypothetical protein